MKRGTYFPYILVLSLIATVLGLILVDSVTKASTNDLSPEARAAELSERTLAALSNEKPRDSKLDFVVPCKSLIPSNPVLLTHSTELSQIRIQSEHCEGHEQDLASVKIENRSLNLKASVLHSINQSGFSSDLIHLRQGENILVISNLLPNGDVTQRTVSVFKKKRQR